MAGRNTIAPLERRHAAIAAELRVLRVQIERIKAEMAALPDLEAKLDEAAEELRKLESSIRTFDPDWVPGPLFGASRRPGPRR
jgi:hypothetical protein